MMCLGFSIFRGGVGIGDSPPFQETLGGEGHSLTGRSDWGAVLPLGRRDRLDQRSRDVEHVPRRITTAELGVPMPAVGKPMPQPQRSAEGGYDLCRHAFLFHRSQDVLDRKSTRLNSSHLVISYAVF